MDKNYQVELFYGYEEGECGIFHAFQAVAPESVVNSDLMAENLAEQLDCTLEDMKSGKFNYNSMYIDLPESLVAKIRADAVKDYLAGKYVELEEPAKNTRVVYRYTDASNYHARNEAVICGVLTPEQKQLILDCLNEGQFFVPGLLVWMLNILGSLTHRMTIRFGHWMRILLRRRQERQR